MGAEAEPAQAGGGLRRVLAEHPWLLVLAVLLVVGGALAGYLYLTPEWTVLRRTAAGAVAGAGIMVCIGGPKLFVY